MRPRHLGGVPETSVLFGPASTEWLPAATTGPRFPVEHRGWRRRGRTRSRCRRGVILKEVHEPERKYRVVISCDHVSCAFDFDRLRSWHQIQELLNSLGSDYV